MSAPHPEFSPRMSRAFAQTEDSPVRALLKRRGLELERVAYVLTRKSSRKYEEIYEQMDQYTARPHLLEVSLRPGAVGYEFWRDKLVGEVRRYLDAQ